jgi:hypothetical protein
MNRRAFLKTAARSSVLAGLGDFAFLARLGPVSAAEARLDAGAVRLRPEVEPVVRFLENTPRARLLEEVAARIKRGLTYRELVAALLLAGVRNIQPRPVGFKFHAVLVVNSAHLASLSSPDSDRWLPIFWALDYFKASQAEDARAGDWTMASVDEAAVPPSHKARSALITALDNWDEAAADAAVVGLARSSSAHEIFQLLCPYAVRDFREIGHKAIFLSGGFRTLEAIGWEHAEPVLRSIVYGMLDRMGDDRNPAGADYSADRPYRRNRDAVKKIRADWLDGKPSGEATTEMLQAARAGSPAEASDAAIEILNRGAAPRSIFDALWAGAGELSMRAPGILSLHAATFTNAVHYAWQHAAGDETRRLLLVQNAAFLPLVRGGGNDEAQRIDRLAPSPPESSGAAGIAEIFADASRDRLVAARKILAYLEADPDPRPLVDAARRLIFLKGRDAHDYKFSSAVLEDWRAMAPPWRDRYLAASVFHLRGSGQTDNALVRRTRAALGV